MWPDLLTPLLLSLITFYGHVAGITQEVWSEWSRCSRSCGGGVQHRTRISCNAVRNFSGGFCSNGSASDEYRLCNTNECPHGNPSFRLTQCAAYNYRQVAGRSDRTWLPLEGHLGCELRCRASHDSVVYSFGKAENGTRCSLDDARYCLHGRCTSIGCDERLGSNKKLDACGRCGGHNDTCRIIKNIFAKPRPPNGVAHVVTIPMGSTNIRAIDWTTGRLVIMDRQGRYRLNGNGQYSWSGRYPLAGSELEYNFTWHNESLGIAGPIDQDLILMVRYNADENAHVAYEFWTPFSKSSDTSKPDPFRGAYQENDERKRSKTKDKKRKMSSGLEEKRTFKRHYKKPSVSKKIPVPRDCPPCKKVKNMQQHFCDSDFVIGAQVKAFYFVNKELRYELHILRSYKNSVSLGRQEFLWTPDNCHCPRLRPHRHYVIMGRVDHAYSKRESRLVVDSNSFVRRLTDKREDTLLRLARKGSRFCNRIT